MSAPLSEQRLAEIRGLDLLGLVGERNAGQISAHFAVLLTEVERLRAQVDEMVHAAMGDRRVRLFDEVGEVRNARAIADAQLARANTLDGLCREKNARIAALETELRIGPPWTCRVCGKDNDRDICVICETDRPQAGEPA